VAALSIFCADALLGQVHQRIFQPLRLTRPRHEALALLYFSRRGELPIGKLGERLMVHPTSVTSTVDTLERLGYAERVQHPTDRRTTLARITTSGRKSIRGTNDQVRLVRSGLGVLTTAQARRLSDILELVRDDAGDLHAGALPHADPVQAAAANWRSHGWDVGEHFVAALSVYRVEELIRISNDHSLRPHQLTQSRHAALATLFFEGSRELPMTQLSRRLGVHPTTATSTVDTLERLGLVDRVPDASDRRMTIARITAQGRTAVHESNASMATSRFGLHALTDDHAAELSQIILRVRRAAAAG